MNKDKIWHLIARKLTGEASKEELLELDQLVQEDSSLYCELQSILHLWEQEPGQDVEYLEATYHLHYEKMKKLGFEPGIQEEKEDTYSRGRFSNLSGSVLKMAAIGFLSVISILAVTIGFKKNQEKTSPVVAGKAPVIKNEIVVHKGSNTQFTLPDGSTVWLNAGSKLNYDKINETGVREVYLTGEGYFDVVRNPKRPFIIHTSKIDIKVLGTQFNVKAYPDDKTVETSLIHGSVEVFVKNRPGEKYLLKPNQKLVLLNETEDEVMQTESSLPIIAIKRLTYVHNDTIAVEASWIKHKFIFEKESFIEVARKMERWYNVKVEFKKKSLEHEILTGDFTKETLKQALDALHFTVNFNYKIDAQTVTIY